MWINFTGSRPFAVKVFVGGINAVSGVSKKVPVDVIKPVKQDYVVPHKQHWLDGIAKADGKVAQFVAVPTGSGYSVEAQISGEDSIGGMQIEIIPTKPGTNEKYDVTLAIKTLTGKTIFILSCLLDDVEDLKDKIWEKEGIPLDQQRLTCSGKQMEDGKFSSGGHHCPADQTRTHSS